jgi:hypothetical protein
MMDRLVRVRGVTSIVGFAKRLPTICWIELQFLAAVAQLPARPAPEMDLVADEISSDAEISSARKINYA